MYRVLYDFGRGQLVQVSEDEIALDAKHPDQLPADRRYDSVKFRMGLWHPKFGSTVFSRDILTGDPNNPRRSERGFFGLRHDDRFPNETMAEEFIVSLTSPGKEGDAEQKVCLALTHDTLEIHGRRVNLSGASETNVLRSTDGRILLAAQNDGNFVLYVDGVPVRALHGVSPDKRW